MGGGTIRAVSKLAGIAATAGGIRRIAAEHLSLPSAARKASPAFSGDATAEGVRMVASKSESAVQKPCLGIDDWVLAGGVEEEEAVATFSGEPMSRVVFGGVPTLQEAKEATSELTVALEKTYLSSPSPVGYKGSVEADNDSSISVIDKQIGENKACVAVGSATPAPAAMMAFRLLHESSMAQNVVASIASDPNVWNAVSQNKELQEFLQSQRECSFGDNNLNNMKLVADSDLLDRSSVNSSGDLPALGNGLMDMLQKIKITVVDMMSNLSDYFQSFFGGKDANGVFVNADGTARLSGEALMEGSFMGLAVMAILVILLKRV